MKVAVIGFGYWAPNVVRALAGIIGAENVVVAEPVPERRAAAREKVPGVQTVPSLDDCLRDEAVRAVCICTPASTHQELALKVISAGRHVFIEKPFATSVAHAEEIFMAAESRRLAAFPGHVHLHTPFFDTVSRLLRSGTLGEIRYVIGQRASLGPRAREDVSAVWDYLIHDVYISCALKEAAPEQVSATGGAYLRKGIADAVFATLEFSGGTLFNLYSSWYAPGRIRRFLIVGSEAALDYDEGRAQVALLAKRGFRPFVGTDKHGNRGLELFDAGAEEVPLPVTEEPLSRELQAFISAAASGETPAWIKHNVLAATATLEAIDRSMAILGAPVSPGLTPGNS